MTAYNKMPFLTKLCLTLIALMLIGYLIMIGRDILVPLSLAMLLSVLLLPVNNYLERKKVPRVAAIAISLTISLTLIIGVFYFLITQVAAFADDIPTIKQHLNDHFHSIQKWAHEQFTFSKAQETKIINDATEKIKGSGSGMIGKTFTSFTNTLIVFILLPIYSFLLLYYRDMIKTFLLSVFKSEHRDKVKDVIQESRVIVQSYMVGLMIELAIVAGLNAIGLLLIGIKYAIFLSIFVAILNMIPYIGMLIATIFCMLITLTTSTEISDVIWVLVALTIVQFIDNNFLMPKVVSSKVKINALMSILGVWIGGALAGVAGMFLSIPVIAILKVIFDRVDGLKPWGFILGDDVTGKKALKLLRRKTPARSKEEEDLDKEKN